MHGTRVVASGMPEGLYITNLLAIKLFCTYLQVLSSL